MAGHDSHQQRLCSTCSSITLLDLESHEGYLHLPNARDLSTSAQTCSLCWLILHDALQKPDTNHVNPPLPYADLSSALENADVSPDATVAIRLRLNNGFLDYLIVERDEDTDEWLQLPLGRDSLRIFQLSASSDQARHRNQDFPEGLQISQDLQLHHLASMTQRWLDGCTSSHPYCISKLDDLDRPLPTRLIYVGMSDKVRLCHTAGQTGHYIALSYCWGNLSQLQTTKANIVMHINGVMLSQLPATCKDAVLVARSLGVSYLWIDALCIIQDDKDDWAREAAKMGDVYSNAYLTLAASRAISSDAGFLGRRTEDIVVKICPSDAEPFYIGSRHSFARDVDRSILSSRAWVLQERVLSRRTLHFTSTQVYWECWTHHQGEDMESLHLGVHKKDAYPSCLAPGADNHVRESDEILRTPVQWWHLLTSYTECKLSFQKDKLIAISGLIDRIGRQTGQKAVAGIFEDYLHPLLLWSACDTALEKDPDLNFPSWSWASRKGRVNHVQLYDWAMNDDVKLILPSTDNDAKLSATMRKLRTDVTYTDPKNSIEYDSFPPELDYHAVKFRFIAPDWLQHDEDALGWLTLDTEGGSEPDWEHLGWVVVACNLNIPDVDSNDGAQELQEGKPPTGTTEGPFYCLLVRLSSENTYERVGVGSILDFTWFDGSKEEIIIV